MGRSSYSTRSVIEYSTAVTIQDLLSAGALKRACDAYWTYGIFGDGEKLVDVSANVRFRGDDSFIGFRYHYKGRDHDFKHQIVRQAVHFGGYRYFFQCGCVKDGQYCGKRVKALYWGGHVYACRHCLELVYLSCRYHRNFMEYRLRANALEKKTRAYRRNRHPRKANQLLLLADDYIDRSKRAAAQWIFNKLC